MIILSPAAEAREILRDRLHQIALHSDISFVRNSAEGAYENLSEVTCLGVIRLSVQCSYRDRLVCDFNNCFFAGGFNV